MSETTATLQRRTLRVLVTSQILGGVGVGAGFAVVGLLAYELSGTESLSGVPSTASTLGAAAAALAIARIAVARGRRPGLATGYAVGASGAALAVLAAVLEVFALHVVAALAIGWANAANLQARYAATDLATPDHRARSLSTIVWATTVGAVLGPNLTGPGAWVAGHLGLPALAGAYVFAFASFAGAALVQVVLLRPDPLVHARGLAAAESPTPTAGALRSGLASIRSRPAALTGLYAIAAGHAVMLGVMVMTPVHMEHHGATLQLVGVTISLHIAGMYAFSPVVGWAADRFGREAVLGAGVVQLVAASLLAALGDASGSAPFTLGLVLLGTGWSCSLIAGSALLTDAVPVGERAAAQGASDLVMNLAGAVGGTLAGVVLALADFPALAFGALLLIVPAGWRLVTGGARTAPAPPGGDAPTP